MNRKYTLKSDESILITPYDENKDKQFVMSIINEHPSFLSYEFEGKPAGTSEKYLTQKDHYTYLLRKNNDPIGFINVSIKEKNNSTDKICSIDLLGIDKNKQKRGYGLLLIEYVLKKLRELNVSEVSLIVNKDNLKAQRLYERIGFIADSKSDKLSIWRYTKKL